MGLRDKLRGAVGRLMKGGGGPSSPRPTEPVKVARPTPAAPQATPTKAAAGAQTADGKPTDDAWYLQGQEDVEGWDQTNPGSEPGKSNLRD
jgi:hypothetical protein